MSMKTVVSRALAALGILANVGASFGHTLAPFPEAAPPDAEVAVAATLPQMPRHLGKFEVALDIPQGYTNEVLVAIGTDADSDGDLSAGEIDIVFGSDCGQRYWMRPKTGEWALGTSGTETIPHWDEAGRFVVPKRHWDFAWNTAVALNTLIPVFYNISEIAHEICSLCDYPTSPYLNKRIFSDFRCQMCRRAPRHF